MQNHLILVATKLAQAGATLFTAYSSPVPPGPCFWGRREPDWRRSRMLRAPLLPQVAESDQVTCATKLVPSGSGSRRGEELAHM